MAIKLGKTLQHLCKGKDDGLFWLCYGNYRNNYFLEIANGIHCFYALIFFSVKALRQ
jgi:hypothetical protein